MWQGTVGSEGGPILLVDIAHYPKWGGSDAGDGIRVHYYGKAVAALPEELVPNPGEWHQVARFETMKAATGRIEAIRSTLHGLVDGLEERQQRPMSPDELRSKAQAAMSDDPAAKDAWLSAWRDHMEGGIDFLLKGEIGLHIDAQPDSDYSRACDDLEGDVESVPVGEGHGLVFDLEGAGLGDLFYASGGSELLLSRSWVNNSKGENAAKAFVSKDRSGEVDAELELELTSGTAAVVWAPVAAQDLLRESAEQDDVEAVLAHAAKLRAPVRLHMPGILGVGSLATLVPGRYRAHIGVHEADEWTVRWLRLARI